MDDGHGLDRVSGGHQLRWACEQGTDVPAPGVPGVSRRHGAAVCAVLGMLALTGCAVADTAPTRSPVPGEVDTGLAVYAPPQRPAAPHIAGTTLEGEQLTLRDLRGRVVVLNAWGSWCAPCREEAPELARTARVYADRGVRFVGIDVRDSRRAATAFVREFNVPYPSWFDPEAQLLLRFRGLIPVNAIPTTVVIDPGGQIAARVVGKVTYPILRDLLNDVLAESPVRLSQNADASTR